jgi:hypothetical protein
MKSLSAIVIVALGLVLFSSCARGYGCPYNTLNENEIAPISIEKVASDKDAIAFSEMAAPGC